MLIVVNQKAKLFHDVNAGNVRILIGSTSKMGAGTNVQQRLTALHYLDARMWQTIESKAQGIEQFRKGDNYAIITC